MIAEFIKEAGWICEYEKIKEVMGTSVTGVLREMSDESIISIFWDGLNLLIGNQFEINVFANQAR